MSSSESAQDPVEPASATPVQPTTTPSPKVKECQRQVRAAAWFTAFWGLIFIATIIGGGVCRTWNLDCYAGETLHYDRDGTVSCCDASKKCVPPVRSSCSYIETWDGLCGYTFALFCVGLLLWHHWAEKLRKAMEGPPLLLEIPPSGCTIVYETDGGITV